MRHPFRSVVRLSVVVDILKTPMRLGGAGLKVDKMKLDGKILALFPKHCKRAFCSGRWSVGGHAGEILHEKRFVFLLVYRSGEILSTV